MQCPRCSAEVSDVESKCGVCGFDVRARLAPAAGGSRTVPEPNEAATWVAVADSLRLYVLVDIAGTLLFFLPFLPIWDNFSASVGTIFLVLALLVGVTGGLKVLALHRFRRLPVRSGGQEMAQRAFFMSAVATACRVAFLGVLYLMTTGSDLSSVESLLRLGASVAELLAMGAICSAIGMYASEFGAEDVRKLTAQVVIGLLVLVVGGVVLGLLGVSEIVAAAVGVAWAVFFWYALMRGRKLAQTLAISQEVAKAF